MKLHRTIGTWTLEDFRDEAAADLRTENAGQCCGGSEKDVEAEFTVRGNWRGWVVYCLKCSKIITEYDGE